MKKIKTPILYIIAFLVIILMHTILLDKIPRGLNADELGSAYDAYSLGRFGVDRWEKSWPLYFINYGDGQNALYTYLLVPIFLLFGTSVYAIRSVIVISSVIMAVFCAKTIGELYEDKKLEIPFLFLYAVMPVFTITLRFGLESHLMMSTASIALYFLVRAIKTDHIRTYFLFGLFAGLVLYTYAIAYLVMPVFLFFSLVYLIIKKNINFKKFLATAAPFVLFALPLFIVQMINKFDLPELKIGIFTFTKLNGYRINELMITGFFRKILSGIKSTFLFDDLAYNSIPKFGNFYYISVPFILIGIGYCTVKTVQSLKKENKISLYAFPLLFWLSYTLISGFMSVTPGYVNITRMNGVLTSLILFTFIGIRAATEMIKKEIIRKTALVLISACYCVLFIFFAKFYFTEFDTFAYPYKWLFFEPYDDEIIDFLDDPTNGYTENTVFLPWNYMYCMWLTKADPRELHMIQPTEGNRDIHEIGRFRMDEGVDLTSEYVIYKYGNTADTINYFRNILHFNELETEHFILFLDPMHDISFYDDNTVLGSVNGRELILTKSYLSPIDNGQITFYGWVRVPDEITEQINVSMITEQGIIESMILDDSYNDGRTVCFQFVMNMDEFFGYKEMTFRVEGMDSNGNVTFRTDKDMTK